MKQIIDQILFNPRLMPVVMAGFAALALALAYIGEYGFGLEPCILCLYQRVPYAIVIALGLIGFFLSDKLKKGTAFIMSLIGVTFLVNSALAFYHTGVEQKWWPSHLEGCAIPDLGSDADDILAAIESSSAVRCDEIAWVDPILGLSMANYNIAFCFGLAVIAFSSTKLIWAKN